MKLKTKIVKCLNYIVREILIDDKTIEESLNQIFLDNLTKN